MVEPATSHLVISPMDPPARIELASSPWKGATRPLCHDGKVGPEGPRLCALSSGDGLSPTIGATRWLLVAGDQDAVVLTLRAGGASVWYVVRGSHLLPNGIGL